MTDTAIDINQRARVYTHVRAYTHTLLSSSHLRGLGSSDVPPALSTPSAQTLVFKDHFLLKETKDRSLEKWLIPGLKQGRYKILLCQNVRMGTC